MPRDRTRVSLSHQYDAFALHQGGQCHTVVPFSHLKPEVVKAGSSEGGPYKASDWNGPVSIESVMDYRYRDDHPSYANQPVGQIKRYAPFLATYYRYEPWNYATYGLLNWEKNQQSHLFFYKGPYGESIVIRHDKLYDSLHINSHRLYRKETWPPAPGGGTVEFKFKQLPHGGWAYLDDLYPHQMDDRYTDSAGHRYGHVLADYQSIPMSRFTGGNFTANWVWGPNASDGGAYRGLQNLGSGQSFTIQPRFNTRAPRWGDWPFAQKPRDKIKTWEAFSSNGNNVTLDMNKSLTIYPGECPPSTAADIEANASGTRVGSNVTFDASNSTARSPPLTQYRWRFGDGSTATTDTARISHSFGSPGTYTVKLTITDSANRTASKTHKLVVSRPPSAALSASAPAVVHYPVTFDASKSTDPDGDLRTYLWDFNGDGKIDNRTAKPRITHTFDRTGTFNATVAVSDVVGVGDTAHVRVQVHPADTKAPSAALSAPKQTRPGRNVTLNASASTDNYGIVEYHWDFDGNGTTDAVTASPTVSHRYRHAGTYNATVTAFDVPGNYSTASTVVKVRNRHHDSGGGGGQTGPPPVFTQVFTPSENAAVVAVSNARAGKTVTANLPETKLSTETGVQVTRVKFGLSLSDSHFSIRTDQGAKPASSVPALGDGRAALSYFDVGAKALRSRAFAGLGLTVEINESRLEGPAIRPSNLALYQLQNGSWERLDTSVDRRGSFVRLRAHTDSLSSLAVGTDRSYTVVDSSLAASQIAQGRNATVNATLFNLLDSRTSVPVNLTLDGRTVATRTVTLPAHGTADVTFRQPVESPGQYDVAVGGDELGNLTVQQAAVFQVTGPSLNRTTVATDSPVAVTATVTNAGGIEGRYTLKLHMFGTVVASRQVTLQPGETRDVRFVRRVSAPGTYNVSVGDRTKALTVTGKSQEANSFPAVSGGGQPGFGVPVALLALLAAALLALRRRG